MSIYDKTVPKPVIDILADMIALDSTIDVRPASSAGSSAAVDD